MTKKALLGMTWKLLGMTWELLGMIKKKFRMTTEDKP
jgi:hypothetical protein